MSSKLWFIAEDDTPIAVYDSKRQALEEKESYMNDNEDAEYRVYSLLFEDFEMHPEDHEEEYNLAMEEGFL
ncbi:MAG: hypothetical protein JW760_06275 [Spirochaetales bacterium]|nr:hypothetical protein [Spirochaetales bacterium]